MSECRESGSLASLPIDAAWRTCAITCECGMTYSLTRDAFKNLHDGCVSAQAHLNRLLTTSSK